MFFVLLVLYAQLSGAGVDRLCMEHCSNLCAELNGVHLDYECGACDATWECNPAAADFPAGMVALTAMGEQLPMEESEQLQMEEGEQLPMQGATAVSPSDSASPVQAAAGCAAGDVAVGEAAQCAVLAQRGYCTADEGDVQEAMRCHCAEACARAVQESGQGAGAKWKAERDGEWAALSQLDIDQNEIQGRACSSGWEVYGEDGTALAE